MIIGVDGACARLAPRASISNLIVVSAVQPERVVCEAGNADGGVPLSDKKEETTTGGGLNFSGTIRDVLERKRYAIRGDGSFAWLLRSRP